MINTRLIIFEGIMGSGKSTLTVFVSQQLRKNRIKQKRVMEADGAKHLTTVLLTLPDWKKPWLTLSSDAYIQLCQKSWDCFVCNTQQDGITYVYDGQFWHGDFTVLMMMDTPKTRLIDYAQRLEQTIQSMNPVFVYLYQNPVEEALERIAYARGKGWVNHQLRWKMESPYCQRRAYSGRDGWIQMYQDYRVITDELYERLQMPKMAIDISGQKWLEYQEKVLEFLGLSLP